MCALEMHRNVSVGVDSKLTFCSGKKAKSIYSRGPANEPHHHIPHLFLLLLCNARVYIRVKEKWRAQDVSDITRWRRKRRRRRNSRAFLNRRIKNVAAVYPTHIRVSLDFNIPAVSFTFLLSHNHQNLRCIVVGIFSFRDFDKSRDGY